MGVSPCLAIGQFDEYIHLLHHVYLGIVFEWGISLLEQSPACPITLQAQATAPNLPLPQL